jgi:nitrogen fixation negative regulator NifL
MSFRDSGSCNPNPADSSPDATLNRAESTEEQFRLHAAALEAAANAIVITDWQGKITWANAAFTKLTGYSIEEVLGRSPKIFKSGKHDREFYEEMWRTLLSGAVWAGEIINRKKNGSLYVEETTITPVRASDGAISHFIAVKEDVTRRKRAEESLRRVKEANEAGWAELDAIVRSLNEGLIVADLTGNIMRANPAALKLHGFATEEEASKPLTYYADEFEIAELNGRTLPFEEWPLPRALRGEVFSDVELQVRRRDQAKWLVLSYSGAPVYDPNGNLIRAIITVRDVTEIKRSESALRDSERQLLRAEKLASAGRMAATIAHEINNPLAAVVNAVFLARTAEGLPEQARFALELAEQELARVTHITKQTLGFYNEPTEPSTVSLAQVVDEVLDLYTQKIKNKNITVRRKCSDVMAYTVEGEFRQIVSNLITNSIDAVSSDGVLSVRVLGPCHLGGSRRMVQVTVADNGEGVTPENLKRVFEPFFTTKPEFGTGLGLWVTGELVRKHAGRIRIHSRTGMGTVVTLWLPMDRRRKDRRTPNGASTSRSETALT